MPFEKIVSVVPSQTELLHYLGLEEQVIGITKFCVHPEEWYRNKQRVGGTKTLDLGKIEELDPDLIIANKEENLKEQIDALQEDYLIHTTDISDLTDALRMIIDIGRITDTEEKAEQLVYNIKKEFVQLLDFILISNKPPLKCAYLIWKDPYMVAASGTFVDDMIQKAGFSNAFYEKERYPEITEEQLKRAQPEIILLSSEPFPFASKHVQEFQEICPDAKVILVDGELFSWYGSRLLHTANYLSELNLLAYD